MLNLKFSQEVPLHGTIRDDLGNPLKNAVVQIGLVSSGRELPGTPPSGWSDKYFEETPREVDGGFERFFVLPEENRQSRTDADGHYEIRGLPRDCRLIAYLDYLPDSFRGAAPFSPATPAVAGAVSAVSSADDASAAINYEGHSS